MGSGVMICIPSFKKIYSGIQKFIGEGAGQHRHTENKDLISVFLFIFLRE
jgi:hypothetical protein